MFTADLLGEFHRSQRLVDAEGGAAEQTRLLSGDDGDGAGINKLRRRFARLGRRVTVCLLSPENVDDGGALARMLLRARDGPGPRRGRGRIAGKKRREGWKGKRVVGRELPDPRKTSNVDRNARRFHCGYVTIRLLTREDLVLYFPPEAFGPFRVLHQIGAGTLGPVFRAHDPSGDRLVAIKVFRLDISPEQSAALLRELEQLIARDIRHRGVAAPLAAGTEGYAVYLATEYVVGESLEVPGRDTGPMPMGEVVRIVAGVAAAIDACAVRGVHHGLLHPRDVILSADGPRLTGFGIGEALSRVGLRLPLRRPYAAPEGASDIYSLAAIAYELISGRRMTPTGWDELSAEDGPELRDAFASALSPDPQRRFATAGEFAAKLRAGGGRALLEPVPVVETAAAVPVAAEPAFESEADPPFDSEALDRFTDAGDASDLQIDFGAPLEPEAPLPSSWSAQPPRVFQDEEPEPARGGRGRMLVLLLMVLAAIGVAAYLVTSRKAAAPSTPQTTSAKPPVTPTTATTVDLPPSPAPVTPAPVPSEPALPAPTPSRPASGAASAPAIRAPVTGRLLIRTTPADATVSINGAARGKTPLTLRDLALGSYTIHVTRNGFASADRRVRLTARRPSESVEISLKAVSAVSPATSGGSSGSSASGGPAGPSLLSVESRPSGARVFVNDRLVGSTPLALPGLPAGPATVRIELDGYQPWITTVRIGAGDQTRVAASLDRR